VATLTSMSSLKQRNGSLLGGKDEALFLRELALNEYDTHIRTANPVADELPSTSSPVTCPERGVSSSTKSKSEWTTGLCDWWAPPQGSRLCKFPASVTEAHRGFPPWGPETPTQRRPW
jgi:hypothetical protein